MKCPICTKKMPPKTVICCPKCWWALPGGERSALAKLHRTGNQAGVASKLAASVRRVEAAGVCAFAEKVRGKKLLPFQEKIVLGIFAAQDQAILKDGVEP